MGAEVPEDATLNDALEPDPVLGLKEGCFVKVSLPVLTPVASGEDAVEDDEVEVEVRVEGRAEAVQEADSSELGVGGRPGTGATEGGPDRTQEDPAVRACGVGIVMQEGT